VALTNARTDPSAWEQAIEFGIDVTLLEANLARTPAERIAELVAMNRVQAQIQSQTLDDATRRKLDAAELRLKFGDLLDAAP